jgi:hypothetical protein
MNMTNALLQMKIIVLPQVLDRSITTMNIKHCNTLSSKIMATQINISNMIWKEKSYVICSSLTTMIGWRLRSAWQSSRWRRWPSARVRRRGEWVVMKNMKKRVSSCEDRLQKSFSPSLDAVADRPARLWIGFRWTIHAHIVHPHPSPRLTMSRPALPGPGRRGKASKRACVFLSFCSPPHFCKCIGSNPPFN